MRSLWRCPDCGRKFANKHQSHACGRHKLADHFSGRAPHVVATFQALLAAAQECGPVTVLPEKTRVAFQVRMSYAAFSLKNHWVDGHVVLARRLDSPRFKRIYEVSPRNQVHEFRLSSVEQVDAEVRAWLREAYGVGEQRHLTRS